MPPLVHPSADALAFEVGTTARQVESSVTTHAELGIEPVFAGLSGLADTNGLVPGQDLLGTDNYLLGGALALGTSGLGLSTLRTYGLGTARFDLASAGTGGLFTHPDLAHLGSGNRALWLHSAYAGLDGFSEEGVLSHLHLRAGRQFHQVEQFGLTFDGATLGYDDGRFSISTRLGTRSAVYDRTHGLNEPLQGGLLAGGAVGYDFRRAGLPISIEAEVLHHSRTVRLLPREAELLGSGREVSSEMTMGRLSLQWEPSTELFVQSYAIFAFPTLSHLVVYGQWALDAEAVLTLDFYQKVDRGLPYDIASLRGVERRGRLTTFESLRLNLIDRQPYSDLQLSLLLPLGEVWWLDSRVGGRLGFGDLEDRTVYDASQLRYGLDLIGRLPMSRAATLETTVGGDGWIYERTRAETATFRGLAAGGETFVQEVRVTAQYVRGQRRVGRWMLSLRRLSAGASAFARYARLDNQFLLDTDDLDELTAGVGVNVRWDLEHVGVRVAYEYARDSRAVFSHLADLHAVELRLRGTL